MLKDKMRALLNKFHGCFDRRCLMYYFPLGVDADGGAVAIVVRAADVRNENDIARLDEDFETIIGR